MRGTSLTIGGNVRSVVNVRRVNLPNLTDRSKLGSLSSGPAVWWLRWCRFGRTLTCYDLCGMSNWELAPRGRQNKPKAAIRRTSSNVVALSAIVEGTERRRERNGKQS
ncbi:MAG: hypothetical protein ACTS6P_01875 [Candidatus Hodgkinia cicadicola]